MAFEEKAISAGSNADVMELQEMVGGPRLGAEPEDKLCQLLAVVNNGRPCWIAQLILVSESEGYRSRCLAH